MAESTASTTAPSLGGVTWVEIPVLDHDRAVKFYKDVFDWTFNTPPSTSSETGAPSPMDDLRMFSKGTTNGALVLVTPENHLSAAKHSSNVDKKKVSVTVTLRVENVDGALTKIEEAGGKRYIPKATIPGDNMGSFAYFLDTEENVLGVWGLV